MMMASMSLMAQTKGGGISQSALQQMEKNQQAGVANKALFNAIANNNIDDLVKNHANEAPVDTHFSIETPSQSIHNQKSSGRCWMFSGLTCSVLTSPSTTSRVEWWSFLRITSSSMISWRRLT